MVIKKMFKLFALTLLLGTSLAAGKTVVKAASLDINLRTDEAIYLSETGHINATLFISGNDVDYVTDYGFIYSFTDTSPNFESGYDGCMPSLEGKEFYHMPFLNGEVIIYHPSSPLRREDVNKYTKSNGLGLPLGTGFIPSYAPNSSFTTVYVRAFARCLDGTFYYGNTLTVRGITPITVNLGTITVRGETSATAYINFEGLNVNYLGDLGMYIGKNESDIRQISGTAQLVPATWKDGLHASVDMNNLEPGTTYYVIAYAAYEDYLQTYEDYLIGAAKPPKTTVFSERIKDFTTPVTVNIEMGAISTLEGVAHDSAIFNGNLSMSGTSNITEKGFVYSSVFNNPTVENSEYVRHPTTNGGDFSMTVSGLLPGKSYFVRVYARKVSGDYIYSNYKMFYTKFPPEEKLKEKPYMTGINQNIFGPDDNGTYIEVAAMLYSLLADADKTYHSPIQYLDVDYSNPLTANIVNFVSYQGYMVGSDTGLFLTNEPISRASMAVIICKVMGLLSEYSGSMPMPSAFLDTDNHWSRGYVFLAAMKGVLNGYNENGMILFKPENFVTRAELAAIFSQMLDRSDEPMGDENFYDVPTSHWAYRFIMNAAVAGY